jgi:hypothetical protein
MSSTPALSAKRIHSGLLDEMNSHRLDAIGGEMEATIRTVHGMQILVTFAATTSSSCFFASLARWSFLSLTSQTKLRTRTGTLICGSQVKIYPRQKSPDNSDVASCTFERKAHNAWRQYGEI